MGEILHARIKSTYGDLVGLLNQIPLESERSTIGSFLVNQINEAIRELSTVSETSYTKYEIPDSEFQPDWDGYSTAVVRVQLGRIISRLEHEYSFKSASESNAGLIIVNKNSNNATATVDIDYTINDLIEDLTDQEGKRQLALLSKELKKPQIDWNNIKPVLIWITNFSKDLFLKIVPILLQSKLAS